MSENDLVRTITWSPWVYGEDGVADDDAAETYHEASKLSAAAWGDRGPGARLLEHSTELQMSTVRAVKRHVCAKRAALPPSDSLPMPLGEALARRHSERSFGDEPLRQQELGALVDAAAGITHEGVERRPLRAAPSGGALYPLELYVAVAAVEGLDPGLYHVDPLRRQLELLHVGRVSDRLAAATPYPDLLGRAAAVLVLAGVFWRSRFKYGLRGYRFALIEAGHIAQNVLLASTSLGLASVPVGGFYDQALDTLLELDGVNESVLYCVSVARRPVDR